MKPTDDPKRIVSVTLDEKAVRQLRWLSKALGEIGVSAAVRWCADKEYTRQNAKAA
jgi:hypothetical protein